jgi:hypothetical protein
MRAFMSDASGLGESLGIASCESRSSGFGSTHQNPTDRTFVSFRHRSLALTVRPYEPFLGGRPGASIFSKVVQPIAQILQFQPPYESFGARLSLPAQNKEGDSATEEEA